MTAATRVTAGPLARPAPPHVTGPPRRADDAGAECLACHGDGRRLAAAGSSTAGLRVLDFSDGSRSPLEVPGEGRSVEALAWCGDQLVAATLDGRVHAWEPGGSGPAWSAVVVPGEETAWVEGLLTSPDGRFVWAAAPRGVTVLDAETGSPLHTVPGPGWHINAVAALLGRVPQALVQDISRELAVLDLAGDGPARRVRPPDPGDCFSLRSGWLAVDPAGRRFVADPRDEPLVIRDLADARSLITPAGQEGPCAAAAFTPDGRFLVAASWGGAVRAWDAATGESVLLAEPHTPSMPMDDWGHAALALSPDGRGAFTGQGGVWHHDLSPLAA